MRVLQFEQRRLPVPARPWPRGGSGEGGFGRGVEGGKYERGCGGSFQLAASVVGWCIVVISVKSEDVLLN